MRTEFLYKNVALQTGGFVFSIYAPQFNFCEEIHSLWEALSVWPAWVKFIRRKRFVALLQNLPNMWCQSLYETTDQTKRRYKRNNFLDLKAETPHFRWNL